MSKSKDIFFYSSLSKSCEQLIQIIMQKELKNKFIFINVNKHKDNIPSIIQKVPCILTVSRQLKTDGSIMPYIEEMAKKMSSTNNQNCGIDDYMIGNDDCQFITNDDNMDNNNENNSQLKGFALWDQEFLITTEAKNGTAKIIDHSKGGRNNILSQEQTQQNPAQL